MGGTSNLDQALIMASVGRLPIEALHSTDNAGLAMARAVAVVRILRADPRLHGVTVLPLSGAQMIVPVDRAADGTATGGDQRRRRIEIRLRRKTEQVATTVKPSDGH
jgi:flagellar motor protein MotB